MRLTEKEKREWREAVAAFYVSGAWIDCARAYRKAHPLCEECLARREITPSEEVHHKERLTPENINDPDTTLNWDNLEALCGLCHRRRTAKERRESGPARRWSVDEEGNVTC